MLKKMHRGGGRRKTLKLKYWKSFLGKNQKHDEEDMKIETTAEWVFYIGNIDELKSPKVGKWMYFFNDIFFVSNICKKAIEKNIVAEAKHSNKPEGVACFYLNFDDIKRHKKTIKFFIENNLIRKTNKNKYYNISFKLDSQTLSGEYAENFHSNIKLENFINLNNGNWIV